MTEPKPGLLQRLPRWVRAPIELVRGFLSDGRLDSAAALTYYAVLSIFPALLALVSVLGLIGDRVIVAGPVVDLLSRLFDEDTALLLSGPLAGIADLPAAGLGLAVGVLVALWTASGYVAAFGRELTRLRTTQAPESWWKAAIRRYAVTIAAMVLVVLTSVLSAVSEDLVRLILEPFGWADAAGELWGAVRWPLMGLSLLLFVLLLFLFSTPVRPRSLRRALIGVVTAIALIILASLAFGLYVSTVANYDRTYGALGGIIVFLLWLWLVNVSLLFGAELAGSSDDPRERGSATEAETEAG